MELYNGIGQKLQTTYERYLIAGSIQTIDYNVS